MKRLESLDILRGFDLFMLTMVGPFVMSIPGIKDCTWFEPVLRQMDHVDWQGFYVWDLIMPLFMFMSGVTIPFSMNKFRTGEAGKAKAYIRIGKRFILLWILGMIAQGNLLSLDPAQFRWFSNTLQAIAVGYVASAVLFINTKPKTQIWVASVLLIGFWVLMMTVGGGDFTPQGNLCEKIDRAVLGSHRDYATVAADGSVIFPEFYTYTWILSSLNFIVTVMTGMFAGELLRKDIDEKKKMLTMLISGASMVLAGWLWNIQMPVIKHIWTSSMVLVSSGYCFLLLALFFYIVDYRKKGGWLKWLKVFGMNSILVYMIDEVVYFNSIPESFLFGLKPYVGEDWYRFIIKICVLAITWWILHLLYKKKIFLRV